MKKLYLYLMLMAVVTLSGAVGAAETTKSGQTSYIVVSTGDADSVVARLKILQETDFVKLTHPSYANRISLGVYNGIFWALKRQTQLQASGIASEVIDRSLAAHDQVIDSDAEFAPLAGNDQIINQDIALKPAEEESVQYINSLAPSSSGRQSESEPKLIQALAVQAMDQETFIAFCVSIANRSERGKYCKVQDYIDRTGR